jgi:ABC-type glutathione transport system ATPase component
MKLLEVENLSIDTDNRRILHQISFSLEQGQIFGLIGESGAGKTMLAYALCGLLAPPMKVSQGIIRIAGEAVSPQDKKIWHRKRGRDVLMMFQSAATALNPYMKIGKQIAEVLEEIHYLSYKKAFEKAKELLEKVGLNPDIANAYPFQLSGGMQQRIPIAIALGLCPKILIADEPTTGLDPVTKLHILNLIRSLKEIHGMAILFISHDITATAYLSKEIGVIHQGHLIETGAVKKIFASPESSYAMEIIRAIAVMDKK